MSYRRLGTLYSLVIVFPNFVCLIQSIARNKTSPRTLGIPVLTHGATPRNIGGGSAPTAALSQHIFGAGVSLIRATGIWGRSRRILWTLRALSLLLLLITLLLLLLLLLTFLLLLLLSGWRWGGVLFTRMVDYTDGFPDFAGYRWVTVVFFGFSTTFVHNSTLPRYRYLFLCYDWWFYIKSRL